MRIVTPKDKNQILDQCEPNSIQPMKVVDTKYRKVIQINMENIMIITANIAHEIDDLPNSELFYSLFI